MIEDVCEVGVELQMDTLRDHYVFRTPCHIPVHLAAQIPAPPPPFPSIPESSSEAVIDCFGFWNMLGPKKAEPISALAGWLAALGGCGENYT